MKMALAELFGNQILFLEAVFETPHRTVYFFNAPQVWCEYHFFFFFLLSPSQI
jgi:hypothetical protein